MRAHPGTYNRRHLVRPVIHHGRTRRSLSTTRDKSGTHHEEVLVSIRVRGEQHILELKLNRGLLPEDHTISYRQEGKMTFHRPKKEDIELCQYTGHVKGKENSWVAVSTCYGLRGVIHDGTNIRYIEPVKGNGIQSLHHMYDHSYEHDTKNRNCEYDDLTPEEITTEQLTESRKNTQGRQKREGSFQKRGFFNANEESRYIELVLVADHAQYLGANRNLKLLHHQLQETTNIANAIFSPQNIFIALTGVEVWTVEDRITLNPNTQITLQLFSEYLTVLLKTIGHYDHAQLMTETDFYRGHVGLAYVGSMCSPGSCSIIYRSAHNVTAATIVKSAYNMVHELGHSFGMHHDSEDCTCPDRNCIMSEKEQRFMPTHWSDCSLEVLSGNFSDGSYSSCLRNKPVRLFGPPSCGNGFIDQGEECDCGVTMGHDSSACYVCCDPETCMLRPYATCVAGACCDLQTCQFKSAGSICRATELECDLPEYCNGLSEHCPDDVFKMDVVPCLGEMCVKRCVPVDERLQSIRYRSKGCIVNCSGHGVCNSNGHCHCDDGFAPPMCSLPGVGGSVNSGPTRPTQSPHCNCHHDVTPTLYAGRLYDSRPLRDTGGRDTYVTALGSITVIMAITFLVCLIKFKIHSLRKEDWKSPLNGIYKNLSSYASVSSGTNVSSDEKVKKVSDEKIVLPKIEITPAILSSVQLKKQRREECMKMGDNTESG